MNSSYVLIRHHSFRRNLGTSGSTSPGYPVKYNIVLPTSAKCSMWVNHIADLTNMVLNFISNRLEFHTVKNRII